MLLRFNVETPVRNVIQEFETGQEKAVLHRALPIRIKSMYNCEEQRLVTMAPPFRGFSAFVRFQCRARLHRVQIISTVGMISVICLTLL
ncbi:hypothetical protein Y032_0233g3119 [Ancylostoma ceylanicum]|uniref:Uncharacterized protein n=1 Tax=Ancylostoma ceylanicum TaxID=53326 RepID=A0A016SG41_9BILA|nr:hypothetical protein Y032_0233g3119 [Ancylostoma ceylanicum]